MTTTTSELQHRAIKYGLAAFVVLFFGLDGPNIVRLFIATAAGGLVALHFSPKSVAMRQFPFVPIGDDFPTFEALQLGLRRAGLESSNLVVGVDFTKSNEWQGARSNGGRCLHALEESGKPNPYERPLMAVARSLAAFDDDGLIPAYGFGDSRTGNKSVFSFREGGAPCDGLEDVVDRYRQVASSVRLLGPTSFAPLIRRTLQEMDGYTILVILADGAVTDVQETAAAIVEASHHAMSIICIGVGDGPWDEMERFDDGLPSRAFDNFQFCSYESIMRGPLRESQNADVAFAVAALQEIPTQYSAIKALGLLGENAQAPPKGAVRVHGPPSLGPQ